jgi:hypothetical protein
MRRLVDRDISTLRLLQAMLDEFTAHFPIVEPKQAKR